MKIEIIEYEFDGQNLIGEERLIDEKRVIDKNRSK
jgi:hypothetical protein